MNRLRAWYAGLKERERRIVAFGGAGLAVMLLIGGVLLPLQSMVSSALERRDARRDDLQWMRIHESEIRAAGGQLAVDRGEPPVVLVDRIGHEAGLADALRGTQPSGGAGVRVQLEAAPFDVMIRWLATLEQRYGLAIESITIDRAAKPGLVNASVTLNRSQR